MKRKLFVISMVILYAGLVSLLFAGIRQFEKEARQWYYSNVTRRMVTRVSGLPVDTCVIGIYRPELPYVFKQTSGIEKEIGVGFTIVSMYQAWGRGDIHRFPAVLMDAIDQKGSVPLLTWEPWVTDFDSPYLKPMPLREKRYLKDVAEGVYDFYIQEWARGAVKWGKPFFLRFAHEMSNSQYPWTPQNGNRPEDYIRAWWHVKDMFDSLGAANVIWVWSPYKAGDMEYYPGHDYVDWVALDIFNYGELMAAGDRSRWLTFDQLVSPLYTELEKIRKPFMVAEVSSTDMGGSREVWYREMFDQISAKYGKIKAVVLFDNPSDRTSGKWTINWSIGQSPEVLGAVKEALAENNFSYIKNYSRQLSNIKER